MEDVKKKLCRFHEFCGAHKIGACVLSNTTKKRGRGIGRAPAGAY